MQSSISLHSTNFYIQNASLVTRTNLNKLQRTGNKKWPKKNCKKLNNAQITILCTIFLI